MNFKHQKRVTVRLKCPNPLFEEWLINWKEQAIAKESKMQHTFNHALQSLRKYPLPLQSGRDCKMLKGFGDKLCKMLDEKLKEYEKSYGTINDNFHLLTNIDIENIAKNSKKLKATKKNGGTTKQYIPEYGSGSYAILISLYTQSLLPNYPGYLSKDEIIQNGQSLVNSSFTKPIPGSRYTSWSSMKTLISKNLVSKSSRPSKFSLTKEGEILARKLYENSDKNKSNKGSDIDNDDIQISSENIVTKYTSKGLISSNLTKEYKNSNIPITDNYKLYDVDIPDEFTDELIRNAWIPENDTFSVESNNHNIKCDSNIDNMAIEDDRLKNYETAIEIRGRETSTRIYEANHVYENCSKPLNSVQLVGTAKQTSSKVHLDRLLTRKSLSLKEVSCENEPISLKAADKSSFQKFYSTDFVSKKSVIDIASENKANSLKKFASSSSITSASSVVENFVMAPHSFDIILYVDNNETSGSSNSQNDEILVSLTRQGIKHEVKDLKIGDFLWICRDRVTKKELVLPYIIERKRMDDFAHSIRDKRYHEQKFRLKRSGIENLIYLVESHGRNQHLGLPLQSLYQAASNTAIQENFFIKFTENTKETVEYLSNFSRMLVKMFKSKTLASCSKEDIQSVDIEDDLQSLVTFKELNESSVKNKKMKITDLFVKMLIQIKGMSVERALAITQLYPTPILLKRMYEENPDSKGEKLLSAIKYGKCGKSIGIVLSKTIYQAFSKVQY